MYTSYNQKIIETPTYIEIWEYEQPIYSKRSKTEKAKKEKLGWLEEKTIRKKFDELSAQGQYDSLKRKQKHYKTKRFDIARLIDTNFDKQTKFLTLTFKENIEDIDYTNSEFKKFIKRLNYQLYKTKKAQIRYLATWEKQKRGAIHYHIILFRFPYVPHKQLLSTWGHGAVRINKIDVDGIENRGRYISKYFDKELELKEHKKKAFFKSQNLRLPKETKRRTDTPYNVSNQKVLVTKEYTKKKPFFFREWNLYEVTEPILMFEESKVRYTKIKKNGGDIHE
ncbi:rolling circle replication-associated protein [Candidatus Enterococcus lemimoniae]|uniref:rolling circle replication-associated protein n=1 Tax=Candidatus Enterococcus lemimoniae TaxID=1834167 RepID=UPI000A3D3FAE|nr:Rep protein [Enterococcus sp. 12C11_DIV0727]